MSGPRPADGAPGGPPAGPGRGPGATARRDPAMRRGPGHDGHGNGPPARSRRTSGSPSDACSVASARKRPLILLVIGLAVVSVFFAILGPKILGDAINIIFDGVVGKQIPAGVTQEQADRRVCAPPARTSWPTCSRA